MLGGSEEKILCHASAKFHVIILITWILSDTRRSEKITKICQEFHSFYSSTLDDLTITMQQWREKKA